MNENELLTPDYLFEVSWEVCNKVGGIHTVVSTKARTVESKLGDNYLLIGPDIQREGDNPEFEEDDELLKAWRQSVYNDGIRIRIGRWRVVGRPIAVLVDYTSLFPKKDDILKFLWETYHVDSISGQWDYIEPVLFGHAAGQVIASYVENFCASTDKVVAHFHEWMTAAGGLYLRKYLKDDPSFTPDEGKSDQPFILMRYAEVMLNAAEAAVELALAGEPSPDGSDLMQVATDAVNEIRERAGAELLESNIQPTTEGRNIVRKERRKELAFEHKTKWDLRRWRVWHYEGRDGFWGETRDKNTYSNNASYRFRGLYPFFSTQAGKWFFDAHFHWVSRFTPSFSILDYYFAIPSGEVSKSSYIDQQPNR